MTSIARAEGFSVRHCPTDLKEVPLVPSLWQAEYDGYGQIRFESEMIHIEPRSAQRPEDTHAGLVLSKFILNKRNFDVAILYKNNRPLRKGNPNPWEVFWLMFQYKKTKGLTKKTNYVIAKPNGMELGTAFEEIGQTFVATSENTTAAFNQWHELRIRKNSEGIRVHFDGKETLYWKKSKEQLEGQQVYEHTGHLGLYTEDAAVTIARVCID